MRVARPKSEMQPLMSWVRRTLEDLMFPWVNFPPPAEWMWATPLAAPRQIFTLDAQSSAFPVSHLPVVIRTQKCDKKNNLFYGGER